jgi:hypothetical protein
MLLMAIQELPLPPRAAVRRNFSATLVNIWAAPAARDTTVPQPSPLLAGTNHHL